MGGLTGVQVEHLFGPSVESVSANASGMQVDYEEKPGHDSMMVD